MLNNIIIGIVVSVSYIIGYFLRKYTQAEVDNFFKDHKGFLKCKKYLEIRAILYGIALAISLKYLAEFSLILFSLGLIEGGVFSGKKIKKQVLLSIITFIVFLLVLFFYS